MRDGALLLIDASNTEYRASAAHAKLTGPDGAFTGGLFGVLQMLSNAILKVGARQVVWCKDSGPYLRSMQYPEYKLIRKSTKDPALEERVKATRQHLTGLLKAMCIPVWELPGYEADDLLALGTMQSHGRFQRVVAMTNDSDAGSLYEYANFHVYNGNAGPGEPPYKSLSDLVGVPMERTQATMLVRLLALSGTHNEVEGLVGIGPKRAWAIVSDPQKWEDTHRQHRALIDRNISLITLPHPNLRRQLWDFPVPSVVGNFDARRLYRFLAPHGINATATMVDALEQVNRGR